MGRVRFAASRFSVVSIKTGFFGSHGLPSRFRWFRNVSLNVNSCQFSAGTGMLGSNGFPIFKDHPSNFLCEKTWPLSSGANLYEIYPISSVCNQFLSVRIFFCQGLEIYAASIEK